VDITWHARHPGSSVRTRPKPCNTRHCDRLLRIAAHPPDRALGVEEDVWWKCEAPPQSLRGATARLSAWWNHPVPAAGPGRPRHGCDGRSVPTTTPRR